VIGSSSPALSFPVSKLFVSMSQSSSFSPIKLTAGRGGGGGARSYDGEKTESSINHSILSGPKAREDGTEYAK
jgi:hypothetical protein